MWYTVNKARFAVEDLQGESIVMDLVEGRLFLLESAASLAWRHLVGGESLEDVSATIEQHYGEASRDNFINFVELMCEQGLLEETRGDPQLRNTQEIEWPEVLGDFTVNQYDDLNNIITMDPIHEIDPKRGWPFEGPF
jgi:hypothetical protein